MLYLEKMIAVAKFITYSKKILLKLRFKFVLSIKKHQNLRSLRATKIFFCIILLVMRSTLRQINYEKFSVLL